MKRLLSVGELAEYLGVGKTTARDFGEEIGALVRINRRVLFDREAVEDWLNRRTRNEKDNHVYQLHRNSYPDAYEHLLL